MFETRYRPDRNAEERARIDVRLRYPHAHSAYVESGAIIFDEVTGQTLGEASTGDWAVEKAWLDAARSLRCVQARGAR